MEADSVYVQTDRQKCDANISYPSDLIPQLNWPVKTILMV
jgi:hypothetical protein